MYGAVYSDGQTRRERDKWPRDLKFKLSEEEEWSVLSTSF